MNQVHESIRWLYQEKGLRPHEIAGRMKIETAVVHAVLRKQGVNTQAQHQVRNKSEPKAVVIPPSRDPCTYCGVRADIGCKHSRRAA